MDYNAKRKVLQSVLYIVLALMIVTIMCITIYMSVSNKAKQEELELQNVLDTDEISPNNYIPPNDTEKNVVVDEIIIPEEPGADVLKHRDDVIDDTLPVPPKNTTTDTVQPDTVQVPETTQVPIPKPKVATTFVIPTHGHISKTYDVETPVYSLTMNDYRVHQGLDFSSTVGSPVYAIANGTIQNIYQDPMMGTSITIDHGEGLKSHYMNLSEETPKNIVEGTIIECGQVIAGIGETSLIELADTSHLHLEMTLNGNIVNPLDYISIDESTSLNLEYTE